MWKYKSSKKNFSTANRSIKRLYYWTSCSAFNIIFFLYLWILFQAATLVDNLGRDILDMMLQTCKNMCFKKTQTRIGPLKNTRVAKKIAHIWQPYLKVKKKLLNLTIFFPKIPKSAQFLHACLKKKLHWFYSSKTHFAWQLVTRSNLQTGKFKFLNAAMRIQRHQT